MKIHLHNLHDNFPILAALVTTTVMLVSKNIANMGAMLTDHHLLLQISLPQTIEVAFYGFAGGAGGWLAKKAFDNSHKVVPFITTKIKRHGK